MLIALYTSGLPKLLIAYANKESPEHWAKMFISKCFISSLACSQFYQSPPHINSFQDTDNLSSHLAIRTSNPFFSIKLVILLTYQLKNYFRSNQKAKHENLKMYYCSLIEAIILSKKFTNVTNIFYTKFMLVELRLTSLPAGKIATEKIIH